MDFFMLGYGLVENDEEDQQNTHYASRLREKRLISDSAEYNERDKSRGAILAGRVLRRINSDSRHTMMPIADIV